MTGPPTRNIYPPSRTDKGRVANLYVARSGWRWPQRCRTLSVSGFPEACGRENRRNGRTAQVHVRATVRTNGKASAEATPPGTCSKPKSPSRAERRRLPASVAGCLHGQPRRCSYEQRLACASAQVAMCVTGCVDAHGAAGAVNRPCVPHAPSGETEAKKTGLPRAGQRTGVMTRVCL